MQDRPNVDELLKAVEALFDEQLVPSLTGARQYNARVAANVIRTVRRELQNEERALHEQWAGLDGLLGEEAGPETVQALRIAIGERESNFSERIRGGDADSGPWRRQALAHVREVVRAKLEASNPKWLEPDGS